MNVIQCANGHFFDADKYETCPHCGAPAAAAEPAAEPEKKERSSFWHRKVKPAAGKSLNEATYGRTVGIFEETAGQAACGEPEKEAAWGRPVPPAAAEAPAVADRPIAPAAPAPAPAQETPEETSLSRAIREASSEQKTVGFFSAARLSALETPEAGSAEGPGGAPLAAKAPAAEPVAGWLVAVSGPHFGESFPFPAGRSSLGRSADNDIVLAKDPSVSRSRHCFIVYEPKHRTFFVQPGEGSGLTYRNDDYITASTELAPRDILEIGGTKLLFVPLCGEDFDWEEWI